jgi:hypothetical protein
VGVLVYTKDHWLAGSVISFQSVTSWGIMYKYIVKHCSYIES